jgi:ribonuclease HI
LAEGKAINIYTDSRYAFATAHIHGAIYKQRGLLTSAGRDIKNKEEILALLEAVHLPKKVAIIHCPGHQRGQDPITKGNQMSDLVAKQVAQQVTILTKKSQAPVVTQVADNTNHIYSADDFRILEDMI